jgi:mannose-6-phosphate isomerase
VGTKKSTSYFLGLNIVLNNVQFMMQTGTHSNCPSRIQLNEDSSDGNDSSSILLSEYLTKPNESTNVLGDRIAAHFHDNVTLKAGDLPFLFKVLSINQALSIQAHPNKQLARQLNQRDAKNYPDSNHKPEMLIAISERFLALCSFRPAAEIAQHFTLYPELADLCQHSNVSRFQSLIESKADAKQQEEALKLCFTSLMNQPDVLVREKLAALQTRLETRHERGDQKLNELFLTLNKQYANDVGSLVIFLLNLIELKKGEAIYLWANVPHAYLLGDGVECMACSDNVVRAGLTPKFKDVSVLCDMLDYGMRTVEQSKLAACKPPPDTAADSSWLLSFRPSVDEFSVDEIRVERGHLKTSASSSGRFTLPERESASILIIVECQAAESSHFEVTKGEGGGGSGNKHAAKMGLVYFIDSCARVDLVVVDDNVSTGPANTDTLLLAYRAYCDIKS